VNLLPTERINLLLQRPLAYGINQLLRVKHTRFTQPLMNIIMLLLGHPVGADPCARATQRRRR